jgi:hypothetical protein
MGAARTIQILLVLFGILAVGDAAVAGQSRDAPAPASVEKTPQAPEERATRPESAQPAPGTPAAGTPAAGAPAAGAPAAGKRAAAARAGQKEPAPKRVPPRRRSVQQVMGSVPPVNTQTYEPTLTPPASTFGAPPSAAPPPVAGLPAAAPPPPAQLNSCVGNFCTDASGSRYNSGTGNATVNSQGRLCNRVGNTMQCF